MEPEDLIEDILEGEAIELDEPEEDGGPEPMDMDDVQSLLADAVKDAVDFVESELAEDRVKAQRYFDGECNLAHEEGRSKVVATKVRDTIRAVKPSLMRVFLSSAKYVEYIPRGPEDVQVADQATTYMHWKFAEMDGYRILSDVFHDALLKRMGVVKAYYEDKTTTKIHTFSGLNDMQFQALMADPDIEVLEHSQEVEGALGMAQPQSTHDVKVSRTVYDGDLCIDSIPPEEFFFDRNARSLDDCYICGHRTDMRVGDLVAMGFDFDEVSQLTGTMDADTTTEQEREERSGYSTDDSDDNTIDPSMRSVMVTEAYMRVDADGTGMPVLHRAILGGEDYKLLEFEPCDEVPFAVFEVDPEPHTMVGRSLADLTMTDQDAATAILRGILDNVAMTNNPRLGVVESEVEMEDVLNNEIGAIVRMRTAGAVTPLEVPFTAGQTMGALQYMDALVEQKTGVTRASMGLDPDALQSTTKAAVNATIQGAAGQVEVMARNLAEGGMRRLFGLLLRLLVKHADGSEMMRLNGEFTPVDPRVWNTSMDVSVNVGLGTGREEEKAAAYREILGLQMQIWQGYGPTNGVVSLTGIRNTLTDMMAASGIRNAERYFNPMNPQIEQQLVAQAQRAAQGQQQADPNAAYLQAEQMKAQVKMQSDAQRAQLDMQKAQADHQRKLIEMAADQDLARDKMAQDLALDNAELMAKYGIKASEAMIKAEQNAPRPPIEGME